MNKHMDGWINNTYWPRNNTNNFMVEYIQCQVSKYIKSKYFNTILEDKMTMLSQIVFKLHDKWCPVKDVTDKCLICKYVKQFCKEDDQKWSDIEMIADYPWVLKTLYIYKGFYIPEGENLYYSGTECYNKVLADIIATFEDIKRKKICNTHDIFDLRLLKFLLELFRELEKIQKFEDEEEEEKKDNNEKEREGLLERYKKKYCICGLQEPWKCGRTLFC